MQYSDKAFVIVTQMEAICSQLQDLHVDTLSAQSILSRYGLTELLTVPIIGPQLVELKCVTVATADDINLIPKVGGVYFIVTNEPVNHTFHCHKLPIPIGDGYEIIYNGTAQDLRDRAKKHLMRTVSKGMSGISMDILMDESVESHTKCCYSPSQRKKTPYVVKEPIKSIENVLKLHLSDDEKTFVTNNAKSTLYFRNGINVSDAKHSGYTFKYYYQELQSHSVRDIIETTWRKNNGVPRLCSYTEGR